MAQARSMGRLMDALPPLPPSVPAYMQVAVSCAFDVGPKYGVPVNVVMAVAEVEGAKPNTVSRNRDGSVDVGRMQVNSVHFDQLAQHGITPGHLMEPGCYPVELATWMIARHMQACKSDLWTCVSRYHSKEPRDNAAYRSKLVPAAARWAFWVRKNFPAAKEFGSGKG